MGADYTEQVGIGRTAGEAWNNAVREATDYYGHQEGYSGAINSGGYGFVLVALPPRFTYEKLSRLLSEYDDAASEVEYAKLRVADYRPGGFYHGKRGWKGNLRKAESALKKAQARFARVDAKVPPALYNIDSLSETMNDKWGDYLAVELRGAEAKRYAYNHPKRRGEKVFIFFGYAPC